MTKTFKHSGDLGDIIFSLPTVKALGGGVLYLDPEGGKSEPLVQHCDYGDQTKLRAKQIENIKPLLLLQPYIKDVLYWKGEKVDYNLDLFRTKLTFGNLADSHLAAFNLPITLRNEPWLTTKAKTIENKPILISRSTRYHGNHGFWVGLKNNPELMKNAVFVGLQKEHEIFNYTFDCNIDFVDIPSIVELAEYINGSKLFICNQGSPHTIAEGLKHKNLCVELYRACAFVNFDRVGVAYV